MTKLGSGGMLYHQGITRRTAYKINDTVGGNLSKFGQYGRIYIS